MIKSTVFTLKFSTPRINLGSGANEEPSAAAYFNDHRRREPRSVALSSSELGSLSSSTFVLWAGIAIALMNFHSVKILIGSSNVVHFSPRQQIFVQRGITLRGCHIKWLQTIKT